MQWENSNLTIDGVVTPTKVINFAIDVTQVDVGGTIFGFKWIDLTLIHLVVN